MNGFWTGYLTSGSSNGRGSLGSVFSGAVAGFYCGGGSPRHVTADDAAPLAGTARRFGVRPVGVFRDAPLKAVADIAESLDLHAIQLHGREDAEYVAALRDRFPQSREIWTAVSVGREPIAGRGADRLLFDNGAGGSGNMFDWMQIAGHPELHRAIVAGGISADSARAAQRLGAYAIDVGSSLDDAPGRKSSEKIAALFEALRPASRQLLRACA